MISVQSTRDEGRFGAAEAGLLTTIAASVGAGIENARLFKAQVEAASELDRQKQYSESLVEISPVAIVTMDRDEVVTGWNPAATSVFGYTSEEAIGRAIGELVRTPRTFPPMPSSRRTRSSRWVGSIRVTRRMAQGPVLRSTSRSVDGAAPRRRRARRLLCDLSRHHRAPARTRARRDALRRDAGARQDTEPRGHVRDDPRRGASSRAVRQLLDPGDSRKPPGDRERARLRRSRGTARSGFDLHDETNPDGPGRCARSGRRSSTTCRTTRISRARSTAAAAFAGGSASR